MYCKMLKKLNAYKKSLMLQLLWHSNLKKEPETEKEIITTDRPLAICDCKSLSFTGKDKYMNCITEG